MKLTEKKLKSSMLRFVNTMPHKFSLYISRFFTMHSIPGKALIAVVYYASEFESLVLRPGQTNYIRRIFLRLKGVQICKNCFIGDGFRLYKPKNFKFIIGENACFGENAGIYVHNHIQIGDDFIAAPGLTINNGSHDLQSMMPSSLPITIGNRVWCGVNVTILAGAKIADDCVIGANSLVTKEIASDSLAYGVPARVIRKLNRLGLKNKIWSTYH